MSRIELKKYGMNLSGRPLGMSTFKIIISEFKPPFELDFAGVLSIGSSFADEVVAKLAELNQGEIKVDNANRIIKKCLEDVSLDKKFEIIYD